MRTTRVVEGRSPWVRAFGALMTVVLLAACGSSTGNASTPAAASPRPTTAPPTTKGPLTPSELAATLAEGAKTVTSGHLTLSTTYGGEKVFSLEGDQTLAGGKLKAIRLNEKVGAVSLTILIVDRVVYVKLPASQVKNGKPWVKATAGSKNPGLKQLAATVGSLEKSTSLNQYGPLAEAASSLKTIAVEQLNGVAVTHYSMLVDVRKVHSAALTDEMKKGLAQAGITMMPLDMWVDEQGRTVKVAERLKVQGETVAVDMTMTRINQRVSIVAPPASQLSAPSELTST